MNNDKMNAEGFKAYDLQERVRQYDVDMDIMHPLRWKMIEIALEFLPFHQSRSIKALDLGIGTGLFSLKFLEKYCDATVTAIDGAFSMMEQAKLNLGGHANRVEWVQSDFKTIPRSVFGPETYDVVFSSFALHHLDAREKLKVLQSAIRSIKWGGWFLNADLVRADAPELEQLIQAIRVKAIIDRASGHDKRFNSVNATRQFLNNLEATEQDQPQTLSRDLRILRKAGLTKAEVIWKEYREVVFGGLKTMAVNNSDHAISFTVLPTGQTVSKMWRQVILKQVNVGT
ncbi:class I SAM-dependent methyltransferase [Gemmatimonadota bacterium]